MFRQPKVAATLVAALMVVFRVDGMSGERRAAQPRACSPHEIIAHVAALSDDSMMGRAPGSEGDRAARRYIIKTLERYGIRPGAWRGFEQRVPLYRVREGTSEL